MNLRYLIVFIFIIISINPISSFNFENVTLTANQDFNFGGSIIVVNGANVSNISLDDLLDVDVPSPSNDNVLTFNSTLGKWINKAFSSFEGLRWLIDPSNGFLYNNSNTLFFNYSKIPEQLWENTSGVVELVTPSNVSINGSLGIGAIPEHQFHIVLNETDNFFVDGSTNQREVTVGAFRQTHTPAITGTRALNYVIDVNNQADTSAIVTEYLARGMRPGDTGAIHQADIDTGNSLGGVIEAWHVEKTGTGLVEVHAIHTGPGIEVLHQDSGEFGNIERAFIFDGSFTDVTGDFNSTTSDVQMFVNDNDFVYIGKDTMFSEVEVILSITASGAGVKPIFEYFNGSWNTFGPADGSNGFRVNGNIVWSADDLMGWNNNSVNSVNKFWVRIQRTANSLTTPPTEDTIKYALPTEYSWDEDGNLIINAMNMSGDLRVNDTFLVDILNSQVNITGDLGITENLAVEGNITVLDRIFFDEEGHYIKKGMETDTSGTNIAAAAFALHHPESHNEGSVMLTVDNTDSVNLWIIKAINGSSSGVANSWAAFPDNDLNSDSHNMSIVPDITKRWTNYGIQPSLSYFSEINETSIASLFGIETQKIVFHNDLGNGGLEGEGTFDMILDGNNANFFNGSIHSFIPVNFTSGFLPGDSFTALSVIFEGGISPFINLDVSPEVWFSTSGALCDEGECAEASGSTGSLDITMTTNFSTLNVNQTELNFVYSLFNLIGADDFRVETNNFTGTGWEQQFTDAGTETVISQSISLGEDYSNLSIMGLRFVCDVTQLGRNCFVDTVKVNGTFTANTTAIVNDFDSEFCGADGSRDINGDCNIGIRWDAENAQWIISGTLNATGTIVGGISGSGTTDNWAKFISSTSIGNAPISDNGSLITMDIDLLVNGNISGPYTNGSVLFSGSNGLISEDNSNLFYDATNNRVGIGIDTPVSSLHLYVDNADTLGLLTIEQDGTGDAAQRFTLTGIQSYAAGIDNTDNFYKINRGLTVGANTDITLDSSGNVGINTASPNSKLQIGNNTADASNILIFGEAEEATETNLPRIHQMSTVNRQDLGIGAASSVGRIRFFTGANSGQTNLLGTGSSIERMQIKTDGIDMGAFTHTANNQGDVNLFGDGSAAQSGAFNSKLKIYGGSAQTRRLEMYQNVSGESFIDNTFSNLNIRATTSDGGTGDIKFSTGSATDMVIFKDDGKVGIGTDSPSVKLTINGTDSNYADGAHTEVFTSADATNPIYQQLNWNSDNIATSYGVYYDGTNFISSDAGSNFQIYKNSDKLNFNYDSGKAVGDVAVLKTGIVLDSSNGFVGIGTSSPSSMFHAKTTTSFGVGIIEASGANSQAKLRLTNDAIEWELIAQGSVSDSFHIRDKTLNAVRFAITPTNGYIGMGTTNPASNLHVQDASTGGTLPSDGLIVEGTGAIGGRISIIGENAGSGILQFHFPTGGDTPRGYIKYEGPTDSNPDTMMFGTNSTSTESPFMVLDENGNLGINTTSPTQKLDVNGAINITGIADGSFTCYTYNSNGGCMLGGNSTCNILFSPDSSSSQEVCN